MLTLTIGSYHMKTAETPEELAEVHRLNFETFVREIPQHHDTGEGVLVDKFHDKNTYLIAIRDGKVVAMLAYHDKPPFSVTDRMPDPSLINKPGMKLLEVRLMAVVPEERHSAVLACLTWLLFKIARQLGVTHFIISSIDKQRDLHVHLGFELLGPDVGPPEARYAPMIATVDTVGERMNRSMVLLQKRIDRIQKAAEAAAAAQQKSN